MNEFYAVGEKEILTAKTPDEAVEEFLDDVWSEKSPEDLPKSVMVQGYDLKVIAADSKCFDWCIDTLIDGLDENYGDPEGGGSYTLSKKAISLFEAFKSQIIAEYPVWACVRVGDPFEMELAPFLREKDT